MLEINNLKTGYGKKLVIDNVSLKVKDGQIVALIGHNGAGKSTILKSVMGILPLWSGKIFFEGKSLNSSVSENVKRGISMLPQGNRIFDRLTVYENLEIASFILKDKSKIKMRLEEVLTEFPILRKRLKYLAGKLSGGEQQILAFGMALIQRPKLLLLDEPSLGLSPSLVKQVFSIIQDISRKYNISVLIVEQKVKEILNIAHYAYVLKIGKVALEGSATKMLEKGDYKKIFLS